MTCSLIIMPRLLYLMKGNLVRLCSLKNSKQYQKIGLWSQILKIQSLEKKQDLIFFQTKKGNMFVDLWTNSQTFQDQKHLFLNAVRQYHNFYRQLLSLNVISILTYLIQSQTYLFQQQTMSLKLLVILFCISLTLGAYVQNVAKELVTYGCIAYQNTDEIQNWSCGPCSQYKFNDITLFSYEPKALFGYVGYSPSLSAVVIAFRGTVATKLPNVVTDITAFQSDYPNCPKCKVHAGFYDGISLLSSAFITALQKVVNLYPDASIYVAGHSLGGALASLAAPIIRDVFPNKKIAQIVTGGKPRVGNKEYAVWYDSLFESFRVIHNNDIVPHVPASGPLSIFSHQQATHLSLRHHLTAKEAAHEQFLTAIYVHEGQEVWYHPDWNTFNICASESNQCINSIWPIFWSIPDHMPPVYLQITSSASQN